MSPERIFFLVDGLRRRWWFVLLPIILALPIAFAVGKLSPKKFEAQSTILMQSANRSDGGSTIFPRQNAIEQVAVLEAWLKSEAVLSELLPQISDEPLLHDPMAVSVQLNLLRRALTLQVIGASALEVKLEGAQAKGLGRKLEIIIARLLEGLVNPESGILNATQMIVASRADAVAESDAELTTAIDAARLDRLDARSKLQALYNLRLQRAPSTSMAESDAQPASAGKVMPSQAERLEELRSSIAKDPQLVSQLERLFNRYEEARASYEVARGSSRATGSAYVRVFDAPERLMVVGRPRDPLMGTSSGRKNAVAVLLLAAFCGFGAAMLAVFIDGRLRVTEDFETIAGVPVLARLPRVRSLA